MSEASGRGFLAWSGSEHRSNKTVSGCAVWFALHAVNTLELVSQDDRHAIAVTASPKNAIRCLTSVS